MPAESVTEFELPGVFRLFAPLTWSRVDASQHLLELRRHSPPGGTLSIQSASVDQRSEASEQLLLETTEAMLNRWLPRMNRPDVGHIRTATSSDGDVDCALTLVTTADGDALLLKLVLHVASKLLYMFQYTGSRQVACDEVLRIFDSFEVVGATVGD